MSYYVTDVLASTQVGSSVRSWTLDPAMRLRVETAETGSSRRVVNHYGDGSSDAPVWLADTDTTGATSTVRMLPGLSGGLAATVPSGAVTGTNWQLVGLHGDVVRTTSPAATVVGEVDDRV